MKADPKAYPMDWTMTLAHGYAVPNRLSDEGGEQIIIDYVVLTARSLDELTKDVSDAIECYWQPLGGILHSDSAYHQPVVMYGREADLYIRDPE